MITKGIEGVTRHTIEEAMLLAAEYGELHGELQPTVEKMLSLIRAEAINLADKIIGKDRTLHGTETELNPTDKAVFDFQVNQRLILAEYQKNAKDGGTPTGPEMVINSELAENEA